MSSITLRSAFETAVASALPGYTFVDSEAPSQKVPVATASPWFTMIYPPAVEEQASMGVPGSNLWRDPGTVFVRVFRLANESKGALLTAAEAVRNFLRGTLLSGVVHIEAVDQPDFDSRYLEGAWRFVDIAVHYRIDVVG